MGRSGRLVLLFDVLAQDRDGCPADGASEVGPGPQASGPPVVLPQVREFLPQPAGGHSLEAVDQPGDGHGWREVHQQVDVPGFPVELGQLRAVVRAHVPHDLLHPLQVNRAEHLVPVLGDEDQVNMKDEDTVPASADVPMLGHETNYTERVRLRYNYRLYPTPGQRAALARAFGCARVVFNDGLRARQEAHAAGLPYITDGEPDAAQPHAASTRRSSGEGPAEVHRLAGK